MNQPITFMGSAMFATMQPNRKFSYVHVLNLFLHGVKWQLDSYIATKSTSYTYFSNSLS